ncbi:EAL domain-containing protein [Janthinobacterium sp. 17J80-10]|uniref:putative bifunctional diguanylate cyclase/phosphodiesterase n=1 Tax=Janthinobacterium sp. 17J80-10 TaxID=2497863 RepID=UPI001005345E|nr:EAL domain-containing protein [Janthinobacterium sp. 17J80-10]QAU33017.1 EAL domain-containing protein [Janthinobacterium sp. 17J80-10]
MAFFSTEQKCALLERITRAGSLPSLLDLLGDEIDKLGLVDGYIVNLCEPAGENLHSRKIRLPFEFRYLDKTYYGYKTSLKGDVRNTNVRAFHGRCVARLNAGEGPDNERQMLARWKVDEVAALPLLPDNDPDAVPVGTLLLMKQGPRMEDRVFEILGELAGLFLAPIRSALGAAFLQDFHERFQRAAGEHARALDFVIEINNLTALESVFDKFAGDVFRQVPFEYIGFFLLEDNVLKNKMVASVSERFKPVGDAWAAWVRDRDYVLHSLAGGVPHAFLKNAPLMFHDVQELLHIPMSETDTQTLKIMETPRTLLVLPIRYQGKPIGSLAFFSVTEPIVVGESDLQLLEKLSAFLGTAIINCKNFALNQAQNAELERLATHDVLTGLPNRALLRDRLQQGIARWTRQGQKATVAFVDLDHFKDINDTLGHSAGDRALVSITNRLRDCLRQSDTVARFGGDEFVLILEDPDNNGGHEMVLQRVLAALCEPIRDMVQDITLSCSIGYSCYPDDGEDVDTLLNAADVAMYQAKQLGRSNIQYYSPDMRVAAGKRLTLEGKLRHAAENNELLLHYQPKADLKTGRIVGVEALVRWQSPELGLVSPGVFIPIAEESGLIVPIGDWILRTACNQALAWQRAGLNIPVAVNLSAKQFQAPGIAARVRDTLEATGLDPHYLELELTESMSMGNPEKSIEIMQSFKALGITLTIDDFGTGYSNLSYLQRFPLDKLKLDQSFVRDMAFSPEALAISQAVLAVAHSLRLKVVAEGVETQEQLQILAKSNCEEMQGYYFSRPLPAEECTRFLSEKRRLILHDTEPATASAAH